MLHEKWLCKVCLNSEVLCALFAPDLFAYLMLPFRIGNVSKVPQIAVLIGSTIKLMQFLLPIGHRRLKTLTTILLLLLLLLLILHFNDKRVFEDEEL